MPCGSQSPLQFVTKKEKTPTRFHRSQTCVKGVWRNSDTYSTITRCACSWRNSNPDYYSRIKVCSPLYINSLLALTCVNIFILAAYSSHQLFKFKRKSTYRSSTYTRATVQVQLSMFHANEESLRQQSYVYVVYKVFFVIREGLWWCFEIDGHISYQMNHHRLLQTGKLLPWRHFLVMLWHVLTTQFLDSIAISRLADRHCVWLQDIFSIKIVSDYTKAQILQLSQAPEISTWRKTPTRLGHFTSSSCFTGLTDPEFLESTKSHYVTWHCAHAYMYCCSNLWHVTNNGLVGMVSGYDWSTTYAEVLETIDPTYAAIIQKLVVLLSLFHANRPTRAQWEIGSWNNRIMKQQNLLECP